MSVYIVIPFCFGIGLVLTLRYFEPILDAAIRVKQKKQSGKNLVKNGPWVTHLGIGRKDTPVPEKAGLARLALGGNDFNETIYWNADVDNDGNPLHSANEYNVVFTSKPLVRYEDKGFWSITVYGEDQFLIENPDKKYMLRSDSVFDREDETHFSFFLSRKKPANPSNWIPLPKTDQAISVTFRCYIPSDEMKFNARNITMPGIVKR